MMTPITNITLIIICVIAIFSNKGPSDAAREVPVIRTRDLLGLQVENMAATVRGRDGLGHRLLVARMKMIRRAMPYFDDP